MHIRSSCVKLSWGEGLFLSRMLIGNSWIDRVFFDVSKFSSMSWYDVLEEVLLSRRSANSCATTNGLYLANATSPTIFGGFAGVVNIVKKSLIAMIGTRARGGG